MKKKDIIQGVTENAAETATETGLGGDRGSSDSNNPVAEDHGIAPETAPVLNEVPEKTTALFYKIIAGAKPPEDITVSQWADKYRRLSPESSAQEGPWRTSKTPYLKEPMDAFTDPLVRTVIIVSASQIGKTEFELNCIGYIIDQDPSSILFIHPTVVDAKEFSKLRIAPMFRDTKVLSKKTKGVARGRASSSNTITQKAYPGGILTLCGSTEAHALASKPIRYVFGDERDRWAVSAGKEGDPYQLALARQTTFYNAKSVLVSTPTVKGDSPIEDAFYEGTQERWCSQCPHCGEWNDIRWKDIRYEYKEKLVHQKPVYNIDRVYYVCPICGGISEERDIKKAPAKWIPDNPDAAVNGVRSFWLNSLVSPWLRWDQIVLEFLQARGNTEKMKGVYNTRLGELWEDRGDMEDEDSFMMRREEYSAELPSGVLVLTCGVDVQDDRLEYEVVGFGIRQETWGIKRGQIMGRPDDPEVWQQLDDIVAHVYRYADGKGLKISTTFVDDGGHYTYETRHNCAMRVGRRVFDCKGFPGDGKPFTAPPKKVKIILNHQHIGDCWQYQIGVDAGKQMIMDSLKVQTPGPRYCHFPSNEDRGYGHKFFVGLLSEKLVHDTKGRNRWSWKVIPGHERNEPLDCRNYALAAFKVLSPDMDALLRRKNGTTETEAVVKKPKKKATRRTVEQRANDYFDW